MNIDVEKFDSSLRENLSLLGIRNLLRKCEVPQQPVTTDVIPKIVRLIDDFKTEIKQTDKQRVRLSTKIKVVASIAFHRS